MDGFGAEQEMSNRRTDALSAVAAGDEEDYRSWLLICEKQQVSL